MPAFLRSVPAPRWILFLLAGTLGLGELLSVLGVGSVLHRHVFLVVLHEPLLASALVGSLAFYLILVPRRAREIAVVFLAGALLDGWLVWHRSAYIAPGGQLLHLGIGPGFVCLVAGLGRAMRGPDRHRAEEALALGSAMPGLLVFAPFVHSAVSSHNPWVCDFIAYTVDGLLGVQPSFLVSRVAMATRPLRVLLYGVYFQLPLWMALAQALAWRHPDRARSRPFLAYALIAVWGVWLYGFFPVVGVKVLCGEAFPFGDWPVLRDPLRLVQAPLEFARNGMPSLHLSWILAAWWALQGWGRRVRLAGALLVLLTAISTFSVGHHFLIDLVIAVPFTAACHAASMLGYPGSARLRIGTIAFGAGATMGWLTLMRVRPALMVAHPSLSVAGLALTVAVSLALVAGLHRGCRFGEGGSQGLQG